MTDRSWRSAAGGGGRMRTTAFAGDIVVTQGFGEHPERYDAFGMKGHNGIDFAVPNDTRLLSPDHGLVTESSYDHRGYGYYVQLQPPAGENWRRAHMRKHGRAGVGQPVQQGDQIGLRDNSSNTTGPHLHLGYRPPHADRG